ncbi:AAA family ATPase [Microbacterium paraoxydans]|uniref:ATP-binding protein n=1 Tax=Microbacterium paraoxydans TaxID=199592 RepID=UPI0022856AC2|nr:AAA family ATPase [Microbacterium paraoxydans]MCZ0710573.1 AAA family ATPase [Microbacterium paraoxydans]
MPANNTRSFKLNARSIETLPQAVKPKRRHRVQSADDIAEIVAAAEMKKAANTPRARSSDSSGKPQDSSVRRELVVTKASDIKSTRQRFLWEGRIPLGVLALFGGRGGVGKSTFALYLGVELQQGRLPGDFFGKRLPILYVSVEDDWETQVKPRLQAVGADMDRVYRVAINETVEEATGDRVPDLMLDMPLILQALQHYGPCVLIIDPIASLIQADDHKRNIVRAALDPLLMAAGETNSTVIGIMHTVKGGGRSNDLLSGSHAYYDAARAVMLFAKDETSDQVVMSQVKGNYAPEESTGSLAYRLVGKKVELDDESVGEYAYVEIVGDSDVSVEELVNREAVSQDVADRARWIVSYLSARGGRAEAAAVIADGMEGIGWTEPQIKSARMRARPAIKSTKHPGLMNGPWIWHFDSVSPVSEETEDAEETSVIREESEDSAPGDKPVSSPRFKRPARKSITDQRLEK